MAWEQITNLAERNKTQKKVFINLDNIDLYFSDNDTEVLCYNKIFNLCQKYVTQYMKFTTNFELKKELANNSICRLYIHFKRTLNNMLNTNPDKKPELVFYLSQFYYYVHLTTRNEVYAHHNTLKKSPQFIEYRSGVDYTQPIENYINSLEDISSYIPVDQKIVLTSNDYNRDNKKIEDNTSYESKFDFNTLLDKVKNVLNEEEIKALKEIYEGNIKIDQQLIISIREKLNNNPELNQLFLNILTGE